MALFYMFSISGLLEDSWIHMSASVLSLVISLALGFLKTSAVNLGE